MPSSAAMAFIRCAKASTLPDTAWAMATAASFPEQSINP